MKSKTTNKQAQNKTKQKQNKFMTNQNQKKQKPGHCLIFKIFIPNFHPVLAEIAVCRSEVLYDVIIAQRLPIVMILVYIDRRDPDLYYGSKLHHFIGVNINLC